MAGKSLGERDAPILNPDGSNREATKELIDALSTICDSQSALPSTRKYAERMIENIKEGYRIQSGEEYD